MKTILCYGDSNTWGCKPIKHPNFRLERYSRKQRWAGIIQEKLGNDYHIVEEGLNSRTTNVDYKSHPNRNGKTFLPTCLYSHAPIDLVILSLGANDLKPEFNRSAANIQSGFAELIEIIKTSTCGPELKQPPQTLILSQPIPLAVSKKYVDEDFDYEELQEKAAMLVSCYADLAKEKNCLFLDVTKQVQFSEIDGMHLDEEGHAKLAQIVTKEIRKLFSEI